MQLTEKNIKPLYRYENADSSISITPIQRNEGDTVHGYRLIADEGCELYYNGENQHTTVLDVADFSGWSQELIPEETSEGEPVEDERSEAIE